MKQTIKGITILLLIMAVTVGIIWLLPVKALLAIIIAIQFLILIVIALASRDVFKPNRHDKES